MVDITALNIYPVKSLRGIALDTAVLDKCGLQFDRQWLVVDHRNRFVTQRDLAGMAGIETHLTDDALVLRHARQPDLVVPLHTAPGPRLRVKIWQDHCTANDAGDTASQWLSAVLGLRHGQALRLVRFASNSRRPVAPEFLAGDSAETAFADGYPFLVTVEESLHELNKLLRMQDHQTVPMNRFRANIVIRGVNAFAENRIDELALQERRIRLALRKPCQRCKIITIDQTGKHYSDQHSGAVTQPEQPSPGVLSEPLRTLVANNPFPDKPGAYFGQNAILLDGEEQSLHVGDTLTVSYH